MKVFLALEQLWQSTLGPHFWWIFLAVQVLSVVTAGSVLLRRRGRPTVAIAWIFALFALPLLGSLFWWTFGRTRIERKRLKRARKQRSYRSHAGVPPADWKDSLFEHFLPVRAQIEGAFASNGNAVQLLADGKAAFEALERSIEEATRSIHLLYYIYQDDATGRRIAERLMNKARSGVPVRLLLDGFGSQGGTGRLRRELVAAGVDVAIFLPSPLNPLHAPRINFTNHRKIAVFDGTIAFTGGMNIGADYEHHWRDVMLRVEGPAVAALDQIFLEDWYFATDQIVVDPERVGPDEESGDHDMAVIASGPDTEAWIHDVYFIAMTRATRRVWLVTPYFIPTPAITMALRTAAGRGLDVRIVVPRRSDVTLVKWASRSFYRSLVSAGVRIFEYGGPMLHAKAMVVDDELSAVGSANIDSRSFGLSFEVSCFVAHRGLCSELGSWIEPLFSEGQEIDEAWLSGKSLGHKLLESAAHLLSPIL